MFSGIRKQLHLRFKFFHGCNPFMKYKNRRATKDLGAEEMYTTLGQCLFGISDLCDSVA